MADHRQRSYSVICANPIRAALEDSLLLVSHLYFPEKILYLRVALWFKENAIHLQYPVRNQLFAVKAGLIEVRSV